MIALISSFLWRVRGGLRFWGHKAPLNKIWYAVFVGVLCYLKGKGVEISVNAAIATYVAYQLNSWGAYIGRLCTGLAVDPEKTRENPLVDEVILPIHITLKGTKYYLWQYPRLYGFVGTTITGFMVTYLISLGMGEFWYGFVGGAMGLCYWFGTLFNKLREDGKNGWGYGEWIFGLWLGMWL